MDANKIDSKIKDIISENQNFYDLHADAAKENIWASINTKNKKRPGLFFIYSLSAACIALLILSGVLGISLLKYKKHIPDNRLQFYTAKSYGELFLRKHPVYRTDEKLVNDTVFITRTEIVNQPVEITNTIRDTIYINKIEYIETVVPEDNYELVEKEGLPQEQNFNSNITEVLINNTNTTENTQKPKIKFRFGGNKDQYNNSSLAITTNF